MQHCPILIVFGGKKLNPNDYFWPPHFNTVVTLPCETQIVEPAVREWCQRLLLVFTLEEESFEHNVTCCNKEDVM